MMGRGKKGRGAPTLFLFSSYHAHSLFLIFLLLVEYPTGASAGWGGGEGGKRSKGTFFFFKDIAKKMVRHVLTNIERQEN